MSKNKGIRVFYSKVFTKIVFETFIKGQLVAKSLFERPIPGVEVVEGTPATDEEIGGVHAAEYLESVRNGGGNARSNGLGWDEGLFPSVAGSTGSLIDAVRWALATRGIAGALSSGLHHASPQGGALFCTINGLAVGAAHALTGLDVPRRVMILDLDAHCGGGTHEHLLRFPGLGIGAHGDAVQVDLSVSSVDEYQPHEPHHLRLVHLESGSDRRYVDLVRPSLEAAAQAWRPGMIVLYNAGVDPVNVVSFDDPKGTIAAREDLVRKFVEDKPAVFTLAGGYTWCGFTEDDVSALHHEMIWRWASPTWMA